MSDDYLITFRTVVRRRGKKFVFRVPLKGKVFSDPGYFYAPYIPQYHVTAETPDGTIEL